MNTAIVFVTFCIAFAFAGPVYKTNKVTGADPQLVNFENDNNGVGPYNFM